MVGMVADVSMEFRGALLHLAMLLMASSVALLPIDSQQWTATVNLIYKTQSPYKGALGRGVTSSDCLGRTQRERLSHLLISAFSLQPIPTFGNTRRQSHDSMSAEAGPVAHKPLFRVNLSPLVPGRSPLPRPELLALPDCAVHGINTGKTPGGCLSTPRRNLIVGRRGKGVGNCLEHAKQ